MFLLHSVNLLSVGKASRNFAQVSVAMLDNNITQVKVKSQV